MKRQIVSKLLLVTLLQFLLSLCILSLTFSCEKDGSILEEEALGEMNDETDAEDEDAVDDSEDEDQTDDENDEPEDSDEPDDTTGGENTTNDCPDGVGFVFEEANGIVSIEFEDNEFPEGWVLKNDASDTSGGGYMQWEGNASLGNPGNGMVVFPIKISTTGTYRFIWHSSFRFGDNGTEHNDSWLRFPDAADFFGEKGNGSIVYPKGTGKTPNPNGSSSDGWFKIFRSGNDNAFKWQSSTSDNDSHNIFVTFDQPGVYLLEVSARSDYHGIDRMLLFEESMNQSNAIDAADTFSQKTTCD